VDSAQITLTAWRILHRSHATSGYVGLSQLKKQKLEAAGSSGPVQALRMENDAPVAGADAPNANSKMVKLDIATVGLESANFRFARYPGVAAISAPSLRSASLEAATLPV
jgi:hypothetical protein